MTKRVKQPRPTEKVCERSIGPIKEPNENDVICGRGSKSTDNPGNIQYRRIVSETKMAYLIEPEKLKKKFVAAEIVQRIRSMNPPGRFLKEDFKGGPLYEIGDSAAFKKVGQALREDAPELRHQFELKNSKNEGAKTSTNSDSGTATTEVLDEKPDSSRALTDKKPSPTKLNPHANAASKEAKKQQGRSSLRKMFSASSKAFGSKGSTKRTGSDIGIHRATLPHPHSLTPHGGNLERFQQKIPQTRFNSETTASSRNGNYVWQYFVDIPMIGKQTLGWHYFDKKTSDGIEKEYMKGRSFCQLSSGFVTFENNFGMIRNMNTLESRAIRRLEKASSQNTQRYSQNDALPSGKAMSHSEVAAKLMSQNKQVAFDISFHPLDGTHTETSSITAASFLSGPSTDSRRRGAAVMQDNPNEPLPIQQVFDRNYVAVQQQLHAPTAQQQLHAPTTQQQLHAPTTQQQATSGENMITTQDEELTFDSSNSKTWCKFGHGAIAGQQQVPAMQKEAVAPNNSICGMEEDAAHAKDEMTLGSINSEIFSTDHNSEAWAAQDEATLGGSVNSRIWGDDSKASQQQQTEPTAERVEASDLISIPEDFAAQDECMTMESFNSRMLDSSQIQSETLNPPGSNFNDGDASLGSAMSMSQLSSRMGNVSIASSHGTISTGSV